MFFDLIYRKNTLSRAEKEILRDSLIDIRILLEKSGNFGQRDTIDHLLELLYSDVEKFIRELNSVAMWGGSGAVWEVFIQDKQLYRKFVGEIIKLVEYMKYIGIAYNKRILMTRKELLMQDILKGD